jgi:hypothetical protein
VSLDRKSSTIRGRVCLRENVEQVLSSLPPLADCTARIYDYSLKDKRGSKGLLTHLCTYVADNDVVMPKGDVKQVVGPKTSLYQVDDIRWQWSDGCSDLKSYSSISARMTLSGQHTQSAHLKCCPVGKDQLYGMCLSCLL